MALIGVWDRVIYIRSTRLAASSGIAARSTLLSDGHRFFLLSSNCASSSIGRNKVNSPHLFMWGPNTFCRPDHARTNYHRTQRFQAIWPFSSSDSLAFITLAEDE